MLQKKKQPNIAKQSKIKTYMYKLFKIPTTNIGVYLNVGSMCRAVAAGITRGVCRRVLTVYVLI